MLRRAKLDPRPPFPPCRIIGAAVEDETSASVTSETEERLDVKDDTSDSDASIYYNKAATKITKSATGNEEVTSEAAHKIFSDQISRAEEWMSTYMSSLSSDEEPRLSKPQLRAYALWHEGMLDLKDIATIWRDPPLKESTVASYVLEAIKMEKFSCDVVRVKDALKCIPRPLKERFSTCLEHLE